MKKVLFGLIIFLAFILRFWNLDSYPGLNADEAAIGYNAYSLLETGKDEHGNSWPIHFQSFNDYKPGLYFYLVLPFVKFIGLNEWAVRIPNGLIGVGTVFLIYLLVKKFGSELLGLVSAFFLAISPWHIHFSRGGWEVNVATFFIVLGLYLFLRGQKSLSILMLSVLSFVLSLYSYHSARIIVPLLGVGLLMIYRQRVKQNIKNFLLTGLVGIVALLPLLKDFTQSNVVSRAAGVGLFADTGPLSRINEQRGEHGDYRGPGAKLLHNKVVNYGLTFLENWTEHFHGEFLILSGDVIQRNKVPETGQMYLFDLIFMIVGSIGGIGVIGKSKGWKIVVWWLVVAPVAAALTFQSPHALRSQNMVIPLVIVSAYGLTTVLDWLKRQKKYLMIVGYCSLVFLIAWSFLRYEHMYWVHMAKEYPFSSQYGVKELVTYVNDNSQKYDKIIITDRYDQPYILFLFYLKYQPERFQGAHKLTGRDKFGFSTVADFDKYEFRSVNFDTDKPEHPGSLIVGTDQEVPDEANVVKEIYGINGYKYFEVVAN